MAQLVFDEIINLTTGSNNTEPKYVEKLMICAEPNNNIYQYYLNEKYLEDKKTFAPGGVYAAPIFEAPEMNISTKEILNFGVKTFPQTGAIAFYKPIKGDSCYLLAPVHVERTFGDAPQLSMVDRGNTLLFTIDSPDSVAYSCYRIILCWNTFAIEYITYESSIEVLKPETTGVYDIYCVGYVNEGEATSNDSNHFTLEVVDGKDEWPGPKIDVDIYPVSATFLADGKLQIKLSNDTTITTNNTATNDVYVTESELTKAISEAITKGGFVTTETMNQAIKESGHATTEELEALDERVESLEKLLVAAEALVDEINGEVV